MTTKELSDKEVDIYRKVFSLHGTMDEKTNELKNLGTFEEYKEIHDQYLTLIKTTTNEKERNEGLKRIIFLNWYHIIEPSCFTGIWELDGDTIYESYSILNEHFKGNKVDAELEWMVSFYSCNEWTILVYSEREMPELTAFVKSIDQTKNHLPDKKVLSETMNDRGQMGEYFKS